MDYISLVISILIFSITLLSAQHTLQSARANVIEPPKPSKFALTEEQVELFSSSPEDMAWWRSVLEPVGVYDELFTPPPPLELLVPEVILPKPISYVKSQSVEDIEPKPKKAKGSSSLPDKPNPQVHRGGNGKISQDVVDMWKASGPARYAPVSIQSPLPKEMDWPEGNSIVRRTLAFDKEGNMVYVNKSNLYPKRRNICNEHRTE